MIYDPLLVCILRKRGSAKLSIILFVFNQAKSEIIIFFCIVEGELFLWYL